MGGKGQRVFRNMYKGHMDKTKGVQDQEWEVEMAGVEGSGGGKMETTVLEQKFFKKYVCIHTYTFTIMLVFMSSNLDCQPWGCPSPENGCFSQPS